VSVSVEGPAVLAGMCSANPSTTERFDATTWRTFDGRALAVIRPTGAGAISVAVTTDTERVDVSLTARTPAPHDATAR